MAREGAQNFEASLRLPGLPYAATTNELALHTFNDITAPESKPKSVPFSVVCSAQLALTCADGG